MWRQEYLARRAVQSNDADTYRRSLLGQGAISVVNLRVEITNGSTSGTEFIFDTLDRVEITANGGDRILSLRGIELYKYLHFRHKRRPPGNRDQGASNVQYIEFQIPFGRFSGDPSFYLNSGNFGQLEISVEYSPTISVTTFATGTVTFDLSVLRWDGRALPATRGYYRTVEFDIRTTLASGTHTIDLPTGHDLVGVFVHAFESGIEDGVDVTDVLLHLDDERVRIIRSRWLELQELNELEMGIDVQEAGLGHWNDQDTFETKVGRMLSFSAEPVQNLTVGTTDYANLSVASVAGGLLTFDIQLLDEEAGTGAVADTTLRDYHWQAKGIGVGECVWVPISRWADLEDTLKPSDFRKATLELDEGGAGANVRTVPIQLVRP